MAHLRIEARLNQLERNAPRPRPPDTPELRRQYCIENGLPEDTVLVGFPGPFIICLPALEDEPATGSAVAPTTERTP